MQVTPAVLRDDFSDPQLAGGLQTMLAKIKTGEFQKIGKNNKELQAQLERRAKLEETRKELRARLDDVETELKKIK